MYACVCTHMCKFVYILLCIHPFMMHTYKLDIARSLRSIYGITTWNRRSWKKPYPENIKWPRPIQMQPRSPLSKTYLHVCFYLCITLIQGSLYTEALWNTVNYDVFSVDSILWHACSSWSSSWTDVKLTQKRLTRIRPGFNITYDLWGTRHGIVALCRA